MAMQFGFEAENLNGNGINYVIGPTSEAMTILSIQVDMSLAGALLSGNAGFAEVLCTGWLTTAPPTFGSAPICAFDAGADQNWGGYEIINPNGIAAGANGPLQLALWATILKAWFPQPCTRSLVIPWTGASPLPAGSYFVLHADHAGLQADFEAQGTIRYTAA